MRYSAICTLLFCCLIQATAQKHASKEPPMRNPGPQRASSVTLLFGWEGSSAYLESNDLSRFQSGVEISFGKNRLYRLNAYAIPFAKKNQILSYHREGLRGELGLGFKKFFYGQLTGHLSQVYIGTQVRSGRHVYTYKESLRNYMRMERGYEWYMFLGDIGIQFPSDWFILDISLSAGKEAATYYHNWADSGPVMQLGISLGLRL